MQHKMLMCSLSSEKQVAVASYAEAGFGGVERRVLVLLC